MQSQAEEIEWPVETSTPFSTFGMSWPADSQSDLITQHQCATSVLLLHQNGNKSLQPAGKILRKPWHCSRCNVQRRYSRCSSIHMLLEYYMLTYCTPITCCDLIRVLETIIFLTFKGLCLNDFTCSFFLSAQTRLCIDEHTCASSYQLSWFCELMQVGRLPDVFKNILNVALLLLSI